MELLHFVLSHLSHSALPREHTKREELRKNVFLYQQILWKISKFRHITTVLHSSMSVLPSKDIDFPG